MSFVFTEYVRSLEPGVEPDSQLLDRVLDVLSGALKREIRRRGLWQAPPSYFGIFGKSWQDGEALQDLLYECYIFVFLERLRALKKQLLIKDNIDGLVFRNVKNFLQAAQERNDPFGHRIFTILSNATRRLIDSDVLRILQGKRIGSETVLAFSTIGSPPPARLEELLQAGDLFEGRHPLEDHVRAWCDHLLPDLVTAVGRGVAGVLEMLAENLKRLLEVGFGVFRFRNILDPLRQEVRARCRQPWYSPEETTGFEDNGGDGAGIEVPVIFPSTTLEDGDSFRKFLDCMRRSIAEIRASRKTRQHLVTFWRFLVDHVVSDSTSERKIPDRQIEQLLGIPRGRFQKLRKLLRGLIDNCRSSQYRKVTVS